MEQNAKGNKMKSCQRVASSQKHKCPDCAFCQWCADSRCNMCRRDAQACAAVAPEKNVKSTRKKAAKKAAKKVKPANKPQTKAGKIKQKAPWQL